MRGEGLDGEAGFGAGVEVRTQFHGKGVRLNGVAVVVGRAVVVEAIQEVVEVDCFYFLFLFLDVHY